MGDVTILVTNNQYVYLADDSNNLWKRSFERKCQAANCKIFNLLASFRE